LCTGRTTIQNAHHIYVLDDGSVIEEGVHEALMARVEGKYQSMVKRQQMEKINDNKDDIMNMEKAREEDEQPICMRLF
jgi:ABC-type glutathione transport system ATPase component